MSTVMEDDDGPPARQVVMRSIAGATPRPKTTAAPSVFAAAKLVRKKRVYLDPLKVEVRDAVPIPPVSNRGVALRGSPYAALFARMKPGQMVQLSQRHAASFVKWGKKHAPGLLLRRLLPDGGTGVWRVEAAEQD